MSNHLPTQKCRGINDHAKKPFTFTPFLQSLTTPLLLGPVIVKSYIGTRPRNFASNENIACYLILN